MWIECRRPGLCTGSCELYVSERHVPDDGVDVFERQFGVGERFCSYVGVGVQRARDLRGDRVKLDPEHFGVVGREADERPCAGTGLEHAAAVEAQTGQAGPDLAHERRVGEVRVDRGAAGRVVLTLGEKVAQLGTLGRPVFLCAGRRRQRRLPRTRTGPARLARRRWPRVSRPRECLRRTGRRRRSLRSVPSPPDGASTSCEAGTNLGAGAGSTSAGPAAAGPSPRSSPLRPFSRPASARICSGIVSQAIR